MKLSKGEKIIIGMLADIHKAVVKKGEGETNLKLLMEAIYAGQLWSLDWEMEHLLDADETPKHVVSETVDYMDMWRFLETDYAALAPTTKTKLTLPIVVPLPDLVGSTGTTSGITVSPNT